jgi:outer membrane protein assembly factor BamA
VYARHNWYASYNLEHGRQQLLLSFLAGRLTGKAPLNERFVLGNSKTLRGWSKHDLDPLGGDRVVSGSADYRYRILRVFYDTGAIWNNGQTSGQKHSAGVGLKLKGGILLAVAFPLREGRADPVFYAGLSF